jgi:hypothetical protein
MSEDIEATPSAERGVQPDDGYEVSRFNALRHGILSKYTVLPWEDEGVYRQLLEALVAEHKPVGPTEEHLVEELAGIFWRKRRLRLGERAAHARALHRAIQPDRFPIASQAALVLVNAEFDGRANAEAISATSEESAAALETIKEGEQCAVSALQTVTRSTSEMAYQRAFNALRTVDQDRWSEALKGFGRYRNDYYLSDGKNLARFLETEILPQYRDRRDELENRSLIRDQSFGDAVDSSALQGLTRYEVHLDRKMERTLGTLIKYQSLRREAHPPT